MEIDLDEVLKMKEAMNASLASQAVSGEQPPKITINDVFIKAMALANKAVPECNSSWMGDFIRRLVSFLPFDLSITLVN